MKNWHGWTKEGVSFAPEPQVVSEGIDFKAAYRWASSAAARPPKPMDTLLDLTLFNVARAHLALKADQSDWRKGVGLISASLGDTTLSCVDLAEMALELRAERDALAAKLAEAEKERDDVQTGRAIRARRKEQSK